MSTSTDSPATRPVTRGSTAILVTVCLALATVVANVACLNLAIPSVAADTGADQTQISWIIDAYALTFAALLLPGGAIGDRLGRRRALIAGLVVFAAASFSVLWLDSPAQLIGVRAVLGVAAALVMPATLSTITGTFDERERVKGVAIWAAVAGSSAILGLVVAGTVLHWFEWQAVFVVVGSLALVALGMTLALVPESADAHGAARDPLGAVLSAAGLFAVVYAVIEAPTHGWTSAHTLVWLGAGLLGVVAFLCWELVPARPLLDPRLFRNPHFAAGTLSLTVQFFCFFGLVFVFLMYLQLVRGWSPLTTALAMLPLPLGLIPTARLAPRLVTRLGQAVPCSAGLLLLAGCVVGLSRLDAGTPYWQLALVLLPLGIGMGLAMPPATSAITDALPRSQQGVASAMNDLSRELGGALGIAVLGSVLNSTYRSGLDLPPQVPPHAAEAIRGSLAGALAVAERVPGGQGPALARMARDAFQSGMRDAMVVGASTVAAGALLVLVLLIVGDRGRRRTASRADEDAAAHR